jgi:hypothetical protein
VRVVSIGSGYSDFKGINFQSGNFILSILQDPNHIIDLFNYIKARSHSYWTRRIAGTENFHEFSFQEENLDFNTILSNQMGELRKYGERYLAKEKTRLQRVIEMVVDQKYRK